MDDQNDTERTPLTPIEVDYVPTFSKRHLVELDEACRSTRRASALRGVHPQGLQPEAPSLPPLSVHGPLHADTGRRSRASKAPKGEPRGREEEPF